jgi:hypothetical protein
MRRILCAGCGIEHLKEAQLGLTEEELEKRVEEDPPLAWRPDFLKMIDDSTNEFWVKKILDEVMRDEEVSLALFAAKVNHSHQLALGSERR